MNNLLESILQSQGGGHERYVNEPSLLASAESVQDGNGILGHILGSKNTSQGSALAGMSGGDNSLLSMLDFDKDGSVMDDVAGLMGKLFKG